MAKLIENHIRPPDEGGRSPQFNIIVIPTELIARTRAQPPVRSTLAPPSSAIQEEPLANDEFDDFEIELTRPELSLENLAEGHIHGFNRMDGDAQPILLIEPKFPFQASKAKVSGYVIVQFDVLVNGHTANIKVLEAQPEQVFNEEAIKAVAMWQYRPKVEGGIAIKQTGLKVRLDFHLKK